MGILDRIDKMGDLGKVGKLGKIAKSGLQMRDRYQRPLDDIMPITSVKE